MISEETKNIYDKYFMNTYNRTNAELISGNGANAVLSDGKRIVDFGSGIGTNSLGFADSDWADAVSKQAHTLQHTSNLYYNNVVGIFAKKLCETAEYEKVFLGNSGAEANECAIKIARKYSFDKYGENRNVILTLKDSFHGRTLATLSATGQESFHNYFFPFPKGFEYVETNNIDDLRTKMKQGNVAAIMFEYIQGESGVIPLQDDFVSEIYKLAEEQDILTIADEIQTGTMRTGTFLAGTGYEKKADITTLAKGIAGGLPLGVCLAGEKCCDTLTAGTHGSTFGGNPISAAGGIVVLDKCSRENFGSEIMKKGEIIRETIKPLRKVKEVTGKGLMIGVELSDITVSEVIEKALEKGLLVLSAKKRLRLLPPLTISDDEIKIGLDILKEILN